MSALLVGRDETVASAGSLTGGELAALLSATPGASVSYVGGVVSYATSGKESLLGVPVSTVYVAVEGPSGVQSAELSLDGDREAIRAQTCLLALDQLRTALGR